ncbi:MAG: protein O-mannosyl-transferase family [Pyrinomonadaceae bacterium]
MPDNKSHSETRSRLDSNHPPLQQKRASLISTAFVLVTSLALYLYTLAPNVTLVDSGELILAAHSLGVAHPPGFPLYVLLAHIFSLLPLGNFATRIHLVSALSAALAATMMTLLVIEATLIRSKPEQKTKIAKKRERQSSPKVEERLAKDASTIVIFAPGMIAGLLFAFSRTLWAYATIAEVYTLNAFLLITIFWLVVSWRRNVLESHANRIEASDRKLYIAAFLFGLALGVHHVTIGLMLPALAALVFATEGAKFFKGKRLLYAALISFLGLSIYVYLPIAASRSPLMNWGDPQTFQRFWWHVTGRQYQAFFDPSLFRISQFSKLALREFGIAWMPLALAFAIAGLVNLFRRDKAMFYFLSLMIVADVTYCLCYEIDEDKDAYYLPAFIALTIAVGFGLRRLLIAVQTTNLKTALSPPLAAVFLFVVPAIALESNFAFNNRSRYFIAHDYVDNILKSVEPRGMLLTNDWQVYSPMLCVKEVEKRRKDTVVIDINQLRRSWYYLYLNQVYPEMMEKSRARVDAFLEDLRAWEQDPDAYKKNPALSKRINSRFYEMILSFVSNQIKDAPVYVTQEIATNQGGQDIELTNSLKENYEFVPQGLIFRVSDKASINEFEAPQIVTRGLADGTLRFEDDDVVRKKVLPVYLSMSVNTGNFFAAQGKHDKAIEWFKQALAIDSDFAAAQRALAASQNALQKQWQAK